MATIMKGIGRGNHPHKKIIYALPPELAINNEETEKQFGYPAVHISPGSLKKVVAQCCDCKKDFSRVRYRIVAPPRCNGCARSDKESLPIIERIDDDATFAEFGYRVVSLARYSTSKVVAKCATCPATHKIRMFSLRPDSQCGPCRRKDTVSEAKIVRRETNMRRFGGPTPSNSPATVAKRTATLVANYGGAEYPVALLRVNRNADKTADNFPLDEIFMPEAALKLYRQYGPPVRYTPPWRTILGDKCAFCGIPAENAAHKVPYKRGIFVYGFTPNFLNRWENLIATCRKCNKKAETPDDVIRAHVAELRARLG